MITAKIGAVSYALWSVLHIVLGVGRLSERADAGLLAEAGGRLAQGHWTLIYIGLFGLVLSWFNWRNNATAFWIAAFIISAEDIGFILYPVIYGQAPFPASVVGPTLWIIGLIFTARAYIDSKHSTQDRHS